MGLLLFVQGVSWLPGESCSKDGFHAVQDDFGFGLAVAVLVYATIVRIVLAPSTMQSLGDRNWYLHSFLKWLPEFRIEAGEAREGAPAVGGDDYDT